MQLLTHSRRSFLATLLAGLVFAPSLGQASPGRKMTPARRSARRVLAGIRHWGCQYQAVNLREITASDLDLVVIDPSIDDFHRRFVTPEERAMLQRKPDGSRRLVLAYLCVGETDVKRWYWPQRWQQHAPQWVGPDNPAWPGSRHVQFWNDEWQSLVFRGENSLLQRIQDIGFDGALLDRTDAYLDWEQERPNVQEEMVDLVEALATKARTRDPGFLLLPQNAELLLMRQRYLDLIDAHNKESLLTGLDGQGVSNTADDVSWSLNYLGRARQAGVRMLATEYLSDPEAIQRARGQLVELGFLPFFGDRQLDRLPAASN
ncbi:MAG: endo alpha-1,4 polygalactosaminidase [Mesorhizobium sp.]|nr:endo alpha-1,4 polygalactosaminidase [Mesorhizobium sp.]